MLSLTWQQTNKQAFLYESQLSLTLHRDIMQFMVFFSFMITFRLTLLTVFTMRHSAWKQTKHSTRKKNIEKHSFSFVRLVTEGPWLSEDERMTVSESEVPHLATPMAPMAPTQSKACSNEYGVHPWVWSSCINHHKVLTNKENLYI